MNYKPLRGVVTRRFGKLTRVFTPSTDVETTQRVVSATKGMHVEYVMKPKSSKWHLNRKFA